MLRYSEKGTGHINAPNETQYQVDQSKKVRHKMKKIKEGTDGIDALDEIPEAERFKEGFNMMDYTDY